jgi:hypothetical protein
MGSNCQSHQQLQRNNSSNTSVCHVDIQQANPHDKLNDRDGAKGRSSGLRRNKTQNPKARSRNSLHPIWLSDGDVPWRGTSLCHHDDWQMVKQPLHEIHTKTNRRIHFHCIQKDAHNATFQTRPKQSIKQPEQEGIWQVGQPDATKSMKVVKAPYLADRDWARGLTIY